MRDVLGMARRATNFKPELIEYPVIRPEIAAALGIAAARADL